MKYETTARRIRQALNEANMTQQELADKSGIGKSSISHYVNGSNEPGNKSAYQLAQALNVNPAWLMGLDVPIRTSDIVEMSENVAAHIDEALALYEKYLNAIPEIQSAVESLLKGSRHDS